MISLDQYDIAPPDDAVRTERIAKPEPESEPVDIFEFSRILDMSDLSHGKDRAVLFSGGDDSLALTHMAMEEGWADFVIHLNTNSSIPENVDYVRSVCEEYGWPFCIISSPMPLDIFAYRYGFPGPQQHTMAYHAFKGRQLGHFYRQRNGGVKYISGVRKLESDRRMKNIKAEVQYSNASKSGNFSGWWISPLLQKSDEWVHEYREKHGLPRNPVSSKIHRSGDCQCLAYGNRSEELINIEAKYPDFGEWIKNVETRVQEYRGRVHLLEDRYPDVAKQVAEIRKENTPNPMKLSVLEVNFPNIYNAIAEVSANDAILRGQMEETNYIGHGGMSSKELRSEMASADVSQQTLCETCGDGSCSLKSSAVQQMTEQAEDAFSQSTQVELPGMPDGVSQRVISSRQESGTTASSSTETVQQELFD